MDRETAIRMHSLVFRTCLTFPETFIIFFVQTGLTGLGPKGPITYFFNREFIATCAINFYLERNLSHQGLLMAILTI